MADDNFDFLSGGGEMGALMRTHDWSGSALGPLAGWPQSLRSMVGVCLNSPLLGAVLWGPDLRMLYNDAYVPSMADLHPRALGQPVREVWGSAWSEVAPHFEGVLRTGRGFVMENVPLRVLRRDIAEITYWTFTAAPIRGEDGTIVGLLNQGTETTGELLIRGREAFMNKLSASLRELADARDVMRVAAQALGEYLKADRAGYAEIAADDIHFTIESDWVSGSMQHLGGYRRLDDFGPLQIKAFREGRLVAVADGQADARTQGEQVAKTLSETQIRATLTVPLVKRGRFAAALYAHCREPRVWTTDDMATTQEVAGTDVGGGRTGPCGNRTSQSRSASAVGHPRGVGSGNLGLGLAHGSRVRR